MLSATVLRTSSSTGGDEVEGQYIPGWKADEEEKLLPSDDGCPYRRRFHPREEQRMGVKVFRSRVSGGSTLVSMFCLGRGGGGGDGNFAYLIPIQGLQQAHTATEGNFRQQQSDYILLDRK